MVGKTKQLEDALSSSLLLSEARSSSVEHAHRSDLPDNMWSWRPFSEVKAGAEAQSRLK